MQEIKISGYHNHSDRQDSNASVHLVSGFTEEHGRRYKVKWDPWVRLVSDP
jgi:hypothetical protein